MRIPLIASLIAVLLALAGCTTPSFSIEKATRQKWYGGAAGSGGGQNYKVFIEKKGKVAAEVRQIWLGTHEKGRLRDFRTFRDSSNTELKDGNVPADVALFRVEFGETWPGEAGNQEAEPWDEVPADLPADFREGAVIWYKAAGKQGAWTVTDFKSLEPIAYP